MLKRNSACKLAIGFVAVATLLTGTLTFALDENEITTSPVIQSQTAEVTTEPDIQTSETSEYTVATYKASQSESVSYVSKKTDDLDGNIYERREVPTTTTTTTTAASEETSPSTSANGEGHINGKINGAPVTTTAAQTYSYTTTKATTAPSYNYNYYYNYTTKATQAKINTPKTTTTTTKATTKYTTTTTAKPVTTTTRAAATTTTAAQISGSLAKPIMTVERTYDTDYTHPYNHQTNQIKIHWSGVSGAVKYMVFVKNGQYSNWTNVATTASTDYTVTGLRRETSYAFAVKAVDASGKVSQLSDAVNIKTARMDYSEAGWKAMCRIVYHEVGGASGSFWDKPIVYVADCVTNQYVCAKYTKTGSWPKYYSKYSSIESIIYTSGGFLSDAGLTSRGATYQRVTERVKKAVWGATYGITYYNNIANDYNIFFWCNSPVAKTSSKIAYGFKIPWGYMYIWRQYWG